MSTFQRRNMNPSTVKKGQKPGTPTPVGGNLKTGLKPSQIANTSSKALKMVAPPSSKKADQIIDDFIKKTDIQKEVVECAERINTVLNNFVEDSGYEPLYELSDGTFGGRDAVLDDQKGKLTLLIVNFEQAGITKSDILASLKKWFETTSGDFGRLKLDVDFTSRRRGEPIDENKETETDSLLRETNESASLMSQIAEESTSNLKELFHDAVTRAKFIADSFSGGKSKQEVQALVDQLQSLLQETEKQNRRIQILDEEIKEKDTTIDQLRTTNSEMDKIMRDKENELNQQIFELTKSTKQMEIQKNDANKQLRELEQQMRQIKADSMRELEAAKNAANASSEAIQNSLKGGLENANAAYAELKEQFNKRNQEIAELKLQIEKMKLEIARLSKSGVDNAREQQKIAESEKKKAGEIESTYGREIEKLNEMVRQLNMDIDFNSKTMDTQEQVIKNLEKENDELHDKIDDLLEQLKKGGSIEVKIERTKSKMKLTDAQMNVNKSPKRQSILYKSDSKQLVLVEKDDGVTQTTFDEDEYKKEEYKKRVAVAAEVMESPLILRIKYLQKQAKLAKDSVKKYKDMMDSMSSNSADGDNMSKKIQHLLEENDKLNSSITEFQDKLNSKEEELKKEHEIALENLEKAKPPVVECITEEFGFLSFWNDDEEEGTIFEEEIREEEEEEDPTNDEIIDNDQELKDLLDQLDESEENEEKVIEDEVKEENVNEEKVIEENVIEEEEDKVNEETPKRRSSIKPTVPPGVKEKLLELAKKNKLLESEVARLKKLLAQYQQTAHKEINHKMNNFIKKVENIIDNNSNKENRVPTDENDNIQEEDENNEIEKSHSRRRAGKRSRQNSINEQSKRISTFGENRLIQSGKCQIEESSDGKQIIKTEDGQILTLDNGKLIATEEMKEIKPFKKPQANSNENNEKDKNAVDAEKRRPVSQLRKTIENKSKNKSPSDASKENKENTQESEEEKEENKKDNIEDRIEDETKTDKENERKSVTTPEGKILFIDNGELVDSTKTKLDKIAESRPTTGDSVPYFNDESRPTTSDETIIENDSRLNNDKNKTTSPSGRRKSPKKKFDDDFDMGYSTSSSGFAGQVRNMKGGGFLMEQPRKSQIDLKFEVHRRESLSRGKSPSVILAPEFPPEYASPSCVFVDTELGQSPQYFQYGPKGLKRISDIKSTTNPLYPTPSEEEELCNTNLLSSPSTSPTSSPQRNTRPKTLQTPIINPNQKSLLSPQNKPSTAISPSKSTSNLSNTNSRQNTRQNTNKSTPLHPTKVICPTSDTTTTNNNNQMYSEYSNSTDYYQTPDTTLRQQQQSHAHFDPNVAYDTTGVSSTASILNRRLNPSNLSDLVPEPQMVRVPTESYININPRENRDLRQQQSQARKQKKEFKLPYDNTQQQLEYQGQLQHGPFAQRIMTSGVKPTFETQVSEPIIQEPPPPFSPADIMNGRNSPGNREILQPTPIDIVYKGPPRRPVRNQFYMGIEALKKQFDDMDPVLDWVLTRLQQSQQSASKALADTRKKVKSMEAIISDQDLTIRGLEMKMKLMEQAGARPYGAMEIAEECMTRDRELRSRKVNETFAKLYHKAQVKQIEDELHDPALVEDIKTRRALQFSKKKYITTLRKRDESIRMINRERETSLKIVLQTYNGMKTIEKYLFNGVVYGSAVSNQLYNEYNVIQNEMRMTRAVTANAQRYGNVNSNNYPQLPPVFGIGYSPDTVRTNIISSAPSQQQQQSIQQEPPPPTHPLHSASTPTILQPQEEGEQSFNQQQQQQHQQSQIPPQTAPTTSLNHHFTNPSTLLKPIPSYAYKYDPWEGISPIYIDGPSIQQPTEYDNTIYNMNANPRSSKVLPFSPLKLADRSATRSILIGPRSSTSPNNRLVRKSNWGQSLRKTYFDVTKKEPLIVRKNPFLDH